MMFYVFSKENIDVAIVEVGIGGQYDQTNIIEYDNLDSRYEILHSGHLHSSETPFLIKKS